MKTSLYPSSRSHQVNGILGNGEWMNERVSRHFSASCIYIRQWLSDLLYKPDLKPGFICQHTEVPCHR